MLGVKRVYEPYEAGDGMRFLVERLWPRGIRKEDLVLNAWLKDVAPSADLRQWYSHDLEKWGEFQRRYRAELDGNPDAWKPILNALSQGTVTLVYSARDTEHNSAVLLKTYLEEYLAGLGK